MSQVIKSNPKQFYPKKVSNINYNSTNFDFINFSSQRQDSAVILLRSQSQTGERPAT